MTRADRPDMNAALQDLGDSTRNAAADVGSSMGAVVTAAVLGGHAAVKSAGASVAGTATGAVNTAGSGVKSSSTAALGTVSATVAGAANRARGALGGTIETMVDKAHSATDGSREQLAVAIQNRRGDQKAAKRSAQVAARAAALKAAKNRIDEMNERLHSRRASSVTELRDSDRDTDVDVDVERDFDRDVQGKTDRDVDVVSDSLLTDASPTDGQADESTLELVTREPATDEHDGEQASVRRRRKVTRREKAAIVASLFDGSEVGDQSDKKSRKTNKRSGSALKLALLVAIAGAVAAAVRALRPSSSGTGASIPPKMRPVPDSRSATTTPASTTTGTEAVVLDTVPTADFSAVDSSPDTTFSTDSDAGVSTSTFGSDARDIGASDMGAANAGTSYSGTSNASTSDVGFTDAFAAADADGEPQQTVLADPPTESDDDVVRSTDTQQEGRHEQH